VGRGSRAFRIGKRTINRQVGAPTTKHDKTTERTFGSEANDQRWGHRRCQSPGGVSGFQLEGVSLIYNHGVRAVVGSAGYRGAAVSGGRANLAVRGASRCAGVGRWRRRVAADTLG